LLSRIQIRDKIRNHGQAQSEQHNTAMMEETIHGWPV